MAKLYAPFLQNHTCTGLEYALHTQNFMTGYITRNNGQGLENILMGLINEPAQTFDKFVTDEMTDFLFFYKNETDHGRDIVALNILASPNFLPESSIIS